MELAMRHPEARHVTLYRGVNRMSDHRWRGQRHFVYIVEIDNKQSRVAALGEPVTEAGSTGCFRILFLDFPEVVDC
jgi:hypothetical protein